MHFDSAGVRIAYDDAGEGRAVILLHGFASSRTLNWRSVKWYDTLTSQGYRAIALDMRGHGESEKLYDPQAYHPVEMGGDVIRLMDHLGIERAEIIGYSMGARIAMSILKRHPERLRHAILAGVGENILGDMNGEAIARALEIDNPDAVADPVARDFRAFADRQKGDRRALAACMRGYREPVDREALAQTAIPLLFIVGGEDTLIGNPHKLADINPKAELVVIPDRDHLNVVSDAGFKEAILSFLAEGA
jgi:pimeloyl-ACP methyl ester carboxylesterase